MKGLFDSTARVRDIFCSTLPYAVGFGSSSFHSEISLVICSRIDDSALARRIGSLSVSAYFDSLPNRRIIECEIDCVPCAVAAFTRSMTASTVMPCDALSRKLRR